ASLPTPSAAKILPPLCLSSPFPPLRACRRAKKSIIGHGRRRACPVELAAHHSITSSARGGNVGGTSRPRACRDYQDGEPIMKKLGMLGIIGAGAMLTAAPLSLQWSQTNVALSLDSAQAREGGPLYRYGSADCGYIPYGTSYAAPCGVYAAATR